MRQRALAIGGPDRFEGMSDVPTVAELGYPGFDVSAWHGLSMPAGTPPDIVARVNDEVSKALMIPQVSGRMRGLGDIPVGGPPAALEQLIRGDTVKWAKLIRDARIQAE